MTAPAAPLEKAVEEAREILSGAHSNCAPCLATGLHTLLAALDADKREAETLVRAIVSERHRCFIPTNIPEAPALMNWDECARRYFARREEKKERDAHIDEISTREVFRG